VVLWRARALLRPWWEAGASPAGLAYAIDHHPDHPDRHRGDALRGAKDPLRVLGYRLQPWRGRLADLPATVRGIYGDYRNTPSPARSVAASDVLAQPARSCARAEVRQAARAAVEQHLRLLRQRRATLSPRERP
jgi:hypothetical protein